MAIRFPNIPSLFSTLAAKFGKSGETDIYFRDYNSVMQKEFDKRTPDDTSRKGIYLTAPDGGVWQITVGDTGTVTTTKVFG